MHVIKVPLGFKINEVKAVNVAKILLDLIWQGHWLVSMPEYRLPRSLLAGSREHALYLTYVISIDYMTDAEKLWQRAVALMSFILKGFTPEMVLAVSERSLQIFLRRLRARFSPSAAKTWKRISTVLMDKYGGDPRNITAQPLTIAEIKERLKDFPYLRGNKLANFYIRAMGETGLFKVKDLDELDIPVDKQISRFTIYTGVLRLKSGKFQGCANDDPLRSLIQEAWQKQQKPYAQHHGGLTNPYGT